jgi:hypothetical protein
MKFHGHDGEIYDLSRLPVESTRPEYLAAKLSRIYRFQGQPRSLSVAEHLALCAQLALDTYKAPGWSNDIVGWAESLTLARFCVTHDLAEAFLGDWHGRHKVDAQRNLEAMVDEELYLRGWLLPMSPFTHKAVKEIDLRARNIERSIIWPEVYGEPSVRVEVGFLEMVDLLGAYTGK